MLASIHPLGERARRSPWWLTVTAYAAGSVAGGAALGGLAGLTGTLVLRRVLGWHGQPAVPGIAVALVAAVAAIADLAMVRRRLPSWHRQVNEDWLHRYRGWVYGVGFGFQLGFGVVTIVTTAAVYAVVALSILSRSLVIGVAIGALFGLVRALPLALAAEVRRPDQLRRLHARLDRAAEPARRLASSTLVVAAVAAGAAGWVGR